jgi:hypothetical protein
MSPSRVSLDDDLPPLWISAANNFAAARSGSARFVGSGCVLFGFWVYPLPPSIYWNHERGEKPDINGIIPFTNLAINTL